MIFLFYKFPKPIYALHLSLYAFKVVVKVEFVEYSSSSSYRLCFEINVKLKLQVIETGKYMIKKIS